MKKLARLSHYDLLKAPLVTEKSTTQSSVGKVTFIVDNRATKHCIKQAVESIFDVKVKSVNTIVSKGKSKTFRGRAFIRSDIKKAIITLQEGSTIELEAGN